MTVKKEKKQKIKLVIPDAMLARLEELLAAGIDDKRAICNALGITPRVLQAVLFKIAHKKMPKLSPLSAQKADARIHKKGNLVVDKGFVTTIATGLGLPTGAITPRVAILPGGKSLLVTFA